MTGRRKLFIALAVFLLLSLGSAAGVVFPIWNSILEQSDELTQKKEQLRSVTVDEQNLERFSQLSQEYEQDFERLSQIFAQAEPPIPFIEFLEGIAESSGIKLKLSPGTSQQLPADSWRSMTFSLTGDGSYEKSFRFLKKLETSPYLVELGNLSMNQAGPEVKFSLFVKVYVQ